MKHTTPQHACVSAASLQAKACEAASTIQAATTTRAAAEDAAQAAEQQLKEAAEQEATLKESGPAAKAAEAARKLADARGEAAEKQKHHDVAMHDASLLKAPVQHAKEHATEYVFPFLPGDRIGVDNQLSAEHQTT